MIAIVDYKAGNLTSVKLAFDAIGVEARVTDQADEILAADRVVFPGVGAAAAGERKNSEAISKQYQAHILGGIKWALGLVPGSAIPNPEAK